MQMRILTGFFKIKIDSNGFRISIVFEITIHIDCVIYVDMDKLQLNDDVCLRVCM